MGDKELGVWSPEQVQDLAALKVSLATYVCSIIPDLPEGAAGDSEDFFACGLDSAQTVELASGLRALLRPHLDPTDLTSIAAKVVYANSTVDSLSAYISSLLGMTTCAGNGSATKRAAHMSTMLDKYSEALPKAANGTAVGANGASYTNGNSHTNAISKANGVTHTNSTSTGPSLRVILTGSTGSLGTQLLQALIADPQVSKIICLNGAEDALLRTQKGFASRNIKIDLSKVEFHKAQFSDPQFSLSPSTYTTLQSSVDIIIYNAWKVNFNQSLESFEDHVGGVSNFIILSTSSPLHPRIMFVSSISSIANWASCYPSDKIIPESSLTDTEYNVALPMGYGESKHVGERMLALAAKRVGIKVDILRVGQAAGPIAPDGAAWNKSE